MNRRYLPIRYASVLFALLGLGAAQQPYSAPSTWSLEQIAGRAGIVFSGTVQKLEPDGDSGVRLTFLVDEGIRGTYSGQTISLRQWRNAGGAGSTPDLRVGEKFLAFFHAAPPGGFTSPVGGSAGLLHFSDPDTMSLTKSQASALMRSARLRSVLCACATKEMFRTVPAADLIRAVRLVTDSP